jgi:hypothetical protein
MLTTLKEMVEYGLLTLDEATELSCYVTNDPKTFGLAPAWLQVKACRAMDLLEFHESTRDDLPHH